MPFSSTPLHLLIIEDNEGDFVLLEAYLRQAKVKIAQLYHKERLSEVHTVLDQPIDLIFLDLSLLDSSGTESFQRINQMAPHIPIVVLSGLSDETTAMQCISLGAQDYLIKSDLSAKWLSKSIQYSIERKRNTEKVKESIQQYESIGRISNDLLWRWDIQSNQLTSPASSFFDYPAEQVKMEMHWWMGKIHPQEKEKLHALVGDLLRGRIDQAQAEHEVLCADGSYRRVFNRALVLKNKKNEPYAIIGAVMDVTERYALEQELLQQQIIHQKALTEASILGQEKQKEEIGKELHDNINQVLASVGLYLELALTQENMREDLLVKCKENNAYVIQEIRKLSHSLMPPSLNEQSLLEAIGEIIDELRRLNLFSIHFHTNDFQEQILSDEQKLTLYRIIQEQLNNTVKYAQAKDVLINLRSCPKQVQLTIADNGVGFDATQKPKGIGLRNIESRVAYHLGIFQLEAAPGKGTVLDITLPIRVAQQSVAAES